MIQFLLAAPRSGSGKTTMTCALLMALKRRGCAPCAFKSGPDYIDPMFHRAVLGVESRSLDLFFSAPETVRTLYAKGAAGHGAAVCEGAMGFYDGLGGVSDRASAWHLADTLGLPVLLVAEPKGQSLTLAAELKGLVNFRTPSHIAGILLNNCTARMHALLAPMLEEETGLPVLGFLPKLPEAVIGSRHLGLYTAVEVENLQQKLALLADAVEEHIDWPRLLALCEKEPPVLPVQPETPPARVRIAVAQDEAFCFTYAETLASTRVGARRLNELVDGGLIVGPLRHLTGCRRQQLFLLFRCQIQKCTAGQSASLLSIRNDLPNIWDRVPHTPSSHRESLCGTGYSS